MKKKIIFPASHILAIEESSFIKRGRLVQRCSTINNGNKRSTNVELHWKPISKIII